MTLPKHAIETAPCPCGGTFQDVRQEVPGALHGPWRCDRCQRATMTIEPYLKRATNAAAPKLSFDRIRELLGMAIRARSNTMQIRFINVNVDDFEAVCQQAIDAISANVLHGQMDRARAQVPAGSYLRIKLVPYVGTDLMCAACGKFGAELGFDACYYDHPLVGVHKKCRGLIHTKRGQ